MMLDVSENNDSINHTNSTLHEVYDGNIDHIMGFES